MVAKDGYYNEFDPFVAQWLRNLIAAGHIAPGVVDERSILDVSPDDLRDFAQCHFFAGLGGWSYALRLAGWADDANVWTASCPCQPFSMAGMGGGFDDERHLWPYLQFLVEQRRPGKIVGEQVASKGADTWLDLVQTDLEGLGYAFGAVAFPSAGVGAPHIRDRTYWVAHAESDGYERTGGLSESPGRYGAAHLGTTGGLGDDDDDEGLERLGRGHQAASGRIGAVRSVATTSESGGLADPDGRDASAERQQRGRKHGQQPTKREPSELVVIDMDSGVWTGPTNGFWRDADWLSCRDGKWRPVEPGTFPLAHGAASRVGRLRAYGNAINVEAARCFLEVVRECIP